MRHAPVLYPILVLACFVNTACVGNAIVNPTYSADPTLKSRLQTIQPMTIALLIDDLRTAEERDSVGQRRHAHGGVIAQVISHKPVTSVFYEALSAELKNSGHTVVSGSSDSNSRTIKVGVKRFWTENQMNFWDITMSGTAAADVVIEDQKTRATLVTRPITGTADESRQFAGEGAFQDALNLALREFVRSFARDSEIIKALREPPTNQ
jgi:uncharacterized lipoprotein YajG